MRLLFTILTSVAKLGDDSEVGDTDAADILKSFGTKVPIYILTLGASMVGSLCDMYVISLLLTFKQVLHFCYQFQYGYDSGLHLTVQHGSVWDAIEKAACVLDSDLQSIANRTDMMSLLLDKHYFQRQEMK